MKMNLSWATKSTKSFLAPTFVVAVWACFYLPRIFTLGFDADDWVFLVHWYNISVAERFQYLGEMMPARPGAVLLLAMLPSVVTQSPHIAQALSAAACLAIALLVFTITRKVSSTGPAPAALAAVTWLLIPWSLGYSAWAVMVLGLAAAILFLASLVVALEKHQTTRTYLLAATLQFLSYITYETFLLQFFIVLVIKFVQEKDDHTDWRYLVKPFFWYSSALLLALIVNRVAVFFNTNASKLRALDLATVASSVAALPGKLVAEIAAKSFFSEPVIFCLLAAMALVWAAGMCRVGREARKGQILILATLAAFVAFSVLLYSVGGYAISFERRSSRVFLGINLLLVLALFFAADRTAAAISGKPVARAVVLGLFFAVPMLAFPAAIWREQLRWAGAWSSALALIDSAPVRQLQHLPLGTAVIYNGPTNTAGFTFMGNIELTGGMFWRHPDTGILVPMASEKKEAFRRVPDIGGWYVPQSDVLPLMFYTTGEGVGYQWDGREIIYEMAGYWVQKARADRLILWDHTSGTLRPLAPCDAVYPAGADPATFKTVGHVCATQLLGTSPR